MKLIKSILYNILWYLKGKPVPPPHEYKTRVIRQAGKKSGISNFIETGTCYGDTIRAQLGNFDYLASVELSHKLYTENLTKFSECSKVHLYEGDSGELLSKMIEDVPNKEKGIVFWLDGHYSGGVTAKGDLNTPIIKELDTIFESVRERFVILIDDAKDFCGENDYPELEQVHEYIMNNNSDCSWLVKDNIIRITYNT